MGISKSSEFSKKANQLALYAKAFGHPARVSILKFLNKNEYATCGDIVKQLPLSQSTVSQHLKELKGTGLILSENEGVSTWYSIHKKEWPKVNKVFEEFLKPFAD